MKSEKPKPRRPNKKRFGLEPLPSETTEICYCPKPRAIMMLVDRQILLVDYAEMQPAIARYRFPGTTIRLAGRDGKSTDLQLHMAVEYTDGGLGAAHFLGEEDPEDLRDCLLQTAKAIGLRLEIIDRAYFTENLQRYSAWQSLIRHLHPSLAPETWPATEKIKGWFTDARGFQLKTICERTGVDATTCVTVVAMLVHSGFLSMDCSSGSFDGHTRIWRA